METGTTYAAGVSKLISLKRSLRTSRSPCSGTEKSRQIGPRSIKTGAWKGRGEESAPLPRQDRPTFSNWRHTGNKDCRSPETIHSRSNKTVFRLADNWNFSLFFLEHWLNSSYAELSSRTLSYKSYYKALFIVPVQVIPCCAINTVLRVSLFILSQFLFLSSGFLSSRSFSPCVTFTNYAKLVKNGKWCVLQK